MSSKHRTRPKRPQKPKKQNRKNIFDILARPLPKVSEKLKQAMGEMQVKDYSKPRPQDISIKSLAEQAAEAIKEQRLQSEAEYSRRRQEALDNIQFSTNEPGFDKSRAELDRHELEKVMAVKEKLDSGEYDLTEMIKDNNEDARYFAGYQVYTNILDMVSTAEATPLRVWYPARTNTLRGALQQEIDTFGFHKVMKSIAESPQELIYYAQQYIEDSDAEQAVMHLYDLRSLIRSAIPTTEERKGDAEFEEETQDEMQEFVDEWTDNYSGENPFQE